MAESRDFVLPNETGKTSTQTESPPVGITFREPMSSKEIMVGAVIVVIGAFMFFFVSRWFTENLVKKRKSPTAASRAGWALFFFLTLTTALFVFGFLGNLWANLMFTVPMGLFCLGSLAFFIMSATSK